MQGIDHLADAARQASTQVAEQHPTASTSSPPPLSSDLVGSTSNVGKGTPQSSMSRGQQQHNKSTSLLAAPPEPKTKHRQACLNCRNLKIKCEEAEEGGTACSRCTRLRIECLWKEANRRGRKPKPWPETPAGSTTQSTTGRTPSQTPPVELTISTNTNHTSTTSSDPSPVASTSTETVLPTPPAPVSASSVPPPPPTSSCSSSMPPYYRIAPAPATAPPPPIRPAHHRTSSYAQQSDDVYTSTSPISLSLVDVARAKEAALSNLGKTRTKVTARPQHQPIYREPYDVVDQGLLTEAEAAQLFDHFHSTLNSFLILFDRHLHTPQYVRQTSTILFTSILAVSAKFFRPDLYAALLAQAKALTGKAMAEGTATVAVIQSICVCVFWKEPLDVSAWLRVGYAIRLAYQLHLHAERKTPFPQDEAEARQIMDRERTWMVLVVFDNLYILRLNDEEDDGFCQTSMIPSHRINPVEWLADTRRFQVDDDLEIGPTLEWVKVIRLAKDIAQSRPGHARALTSHLQGILETAYDRWVVPPNRDSTPNERRRAIRVQFFMTAAFVALHRASLEATELTEESLRRYHINGINDHALARFLTYSASMVQSIEDLESEKMIQFFQDLLSPPLYSFGEFLVKLYPGAGPHTQATIINLLSRTHRAFDNAAAGRDDTTPAFISRFFQLTLRIVGAPPPTTMVPTQTVPLAPPVMPGPDQSYPPRMIHRDSNGVPYPSNTHTTTHSNSNDNPNTNDQSHSLPMSYLPVSFVDSINDDTQYWGSLFPGGTGWFDQSLDDLLRPNMS